jgi:hypothetical protein
MPMHLRFARFFEGNAEREMCIKDRCSCCDEHAYKGWDLEPHGGVGECGKIEQVPEGCARTGHRKERGSLTTFGPTISRAEGAG